MSFSLKLIVLKIFFRCLLSSTYYVEQNKCTPASDCIGSEAFPFPSLFYGLSKIFEKPLADGESIKLFLKDQILDMTANPESQAPGYFRYFEMTKPAVLEIQSSSASGISELNFGKGVCFGFNITRGRLKLANMQFLGDLKSFYLEYSIEELLREPLPPAFFLLQSDNSTSLELVNCSFSGTFKSWANVKKFGVNSLIVALQHSGQSALNINIENVKFTNIRYPQGIIYTRGCDGSLCLQPSLLVAVRDAVFQKCGNKKFLHWESSSLMSAKSEEYYDFAIILNNSVLNADKVALNDSSRFLLGNSGNEISLQDLEFYNKIDRDAADWPPPEFLYFIKNNKITSKRMKLFNISIHSYDDSIHINGRDSTYFSSPSNLLPPYLGDFERCQAFIKFFEGNSAIWYETVISGLTLIQNLNFMLSFFHLEKSNSLSVKFIFIENVLMDVEKKIGCMAFFKLEYSNEFNLSNLTMSNSEFYSFSSLHFLYVVLQNTVNLKSLHLYNFMFSSKSNLVDINKFRENLLTKGESLLFSNLGVIKSLSFSLFVVANIFTAENVFASDFFCLFGCFNNFFAKNTATLVNFTFERINSEILCNFVSLFKDNTISARNLNISMARSFSGLFFAYISNSAEILDSLVNSSWGQGGFDFFDFYSSGFQSLADYNNLTMTNCSVKFGKSDIMSGSLTAGSNNRLSVLSCIFQKIESSSTISDAGVIYLDQFNTLDVHMTSFIGNIGNKGGILWANFRNKIKFSHCNFMENKGIISSVLYTMRDNAIEFSHSEFFKNKAFSDGGLALINGADHVIILISCEFIDNETPLKNEALLKISSKNYFFIENILIESGAKHVGDFCLILSLSTIVIKNITVRNTFSFKNLFIFESENDISVNNLFLYNTSIEENIVVLNFFNRINITDFIAFNISLQGKTAKILFAQEFNNISIINLNISNTSGVFYLVVLLYKNFLYLQKLSLLDLILINSEGTFIDFERGNKVFFEECEIKNLEGVNNEIFLIAIHIKNEIIFKNININGLIKSEQDNKNSTLIRISGHENTLDIFDSYIYLVNPLLTEMSYVSLMVIEGTLNVLNITNGTCKLINLTNMVESGQKNMLFIRKIRIHSCIMLSDLLIFNQSLLHISHVHFINNSLSIHSFLIRLFGNSTCSGLKITIGSNNNFVLQSQSNFSLSSSVINSCKDIGQPGALLTLEKYSQAILHKVDILCRSNRMNSNIFLNQSSLKITSSMVGFNEAFSGGFAKIDSESNITMLENYFITNRAYEGGVLSLLNNNNTEILKNVFLFNLAFRFNSDFKNLLPAKGGCFFFHFREENTTVLLKNNKFSGNNAEIGGVFFSAGFNFETKLKAAKLCEDNIVSKPEAKYYGVIQASFSKTISVIQGNDLNRIPHSSFIKIPEKVGPGRKFEDCAAQIVLYDSFGQPAFGVFNLSEKNISLNNIEAFYTIENYFPCLKKVTPLSFLALSHYVEEEMIFQFKAGLFLPNGTGFENASFSFSFKFRRCQTGEYFDMKKLLCAECDPNFYSFDEDFLEPSSCKSCSVMPFNCYGGFNITPKPKYWRRSYLSTNFIECPIQSACLGDVLIDEKIGKFTILYISPELASPTGTCAYGYKGILCNKCIQGYSKIEGTKCSPCSDYTSLILIVLKISLRIFLYIYMIMKALTFSKNLENNRISIGLVYSNFMIKIIILHIQFLKAFFNFPFSFPTFFDQIFYYLSISISSGIDKAMNLDCYFTFKHFRERYLNTIISMISPIIFVSLTIIIMKFRQVIKRKWRSPFSNIESSGGSRPRSSSFSSLFKNFFSFYLIIVCIMLSYDDIVSKLLEHFSYININDNKNPEFRLVNDFETDFNSTGHRIWIFSVVLPSSFFFVFLIPLFIFINICIRKNDRSLNDENFLLRFGYFIFAYSEKRPFYEFVYIFRRIFLLILEIFFIKIFAISNNHNPISYLITMCFFFSLNLLNTNRSPPYNEEKYPRLNRLETLFLSVQCITCWSGAFFLSINPEGKTIFDVVRIMFYIIVGSTNILAILVWIYFYWKLCVKEKLHVFIKTLKTRIKSEKIKINKKRDSEQLKVVKIYEDSSPRSLFKKNFRRQNLIDDRIEYLEKIIEELREENESLKKRLDMMTKIHGESRSTSNAHREFDESPVNLINSSFGNFQKRLTNKNLLSDSYPGSHVLKIGAKNQLVQEANQRNILSLIEKLFEKASDSISGKIFYEHDIFVAKLVDKRVRGSVFSGFYLSIDVLIHRKQGAFNASQPSITVPPRESNKY